MGRVLALLTLAACLAGCGLAGTGAAGAAGGTAEVQQAAEAKKTEDRVHQQLDEAFKQAADQRQSAESQAR